MDIRRCYTRSPRSRPVVLFDGPLRCDAERQSGASTLTPSLFVPAPFAIFRSEKTQSLIWHKSFGAAAVHDGSSKEDVMKAQDVMTQYVTSVGPEDSVSKAVRIMLQNEISGL